MPLPIEYQVRFNFDNGSTTKIHQLLKKISQRSYSLSEPQVHLKQDYQTILSALEFEYDEEQIKILNGDQFKLKTSNQFLSFSDILEKKYGSVAKRGHHKAETPDPSFWHHFNHVIYKTDSHIWTPLQLDSTLDPQTNALLWRNLYTTAFLTTDFIAKGNHHDAFVTGALLDTYFSGNYPAGIAEKSQAVVIAKSVNEITV